MNLPSWDVFLTIFFIIGIAYGFLLQRDKIIISLVSVYIAIVVSNAFAGVIQQFFAGDKVLFGQVWIRANASLFTIEIILFALTIFLISARGSFLTKKSRSSSGLPPIEILAYSFFNTVLIISSVISFLPQATEQHLLESSKLASRIMNLQLWWIVLPVILLVFTGFSRGGSSRSSEE